MVSSNVSAVATSGNDLYIRFHNGSLYRYKNKAKLEERLIAAASKGKWVWRFLRRPNVAYSKVGSMPLDSDRDITDEELFAEQVGIPVDEVDLTSMAQLDKFNMATVGLINQTMNVSQLIAGSDVALLLATMGNIT